MRGAMRCQFCEQPGCRVDPRSDIRGIMRRLAVGNLAGARKRAAKCPECYTPEALRDSEAHCVLASEAEGSVAIRDIIGFLLSEVPDGRENI